MTGIKVSQISKSFGSKQALQQVSCELPKGKIIGILGPNGAGKSTFIRCLIGITQPDSGEIQYDGHSFTKVLQHSIGYLPEERGLYRKMKVMDQLEFFGTIKGLSRKEAKANAAYWLERFQYSHLAVQVLERLSKGQQQVIQFIASVIHNPEWLVLDEPFSGFDPANAELVRKEIIRLNKEKGTTILYSTHRMETVEGLCDELIFIHQSKLVMQGKPQDIRLKYAKGYVSIKLRSEFPASLQSYLVSELADKEYHLKEVSVKEVITHLDADSNIIEIKEVIPSMQEVFLTVVGVA